MRGLLNDLNVVHWYFGLLLMLRLRSYSNHWLGRLHDEGRLKLDLLSRSNARKDIKYRSRLWLLLVCVECLKCQLFKRLLILRLPDKLEVETSHIIFSITPARGCNDTILSELHQIKLVQREERLAGQGVLALFVN